MKMKAKTGYKFVFWLFVIMTIAAYIWGIYSIIRWIIHLF